MQDADVHSERARHHAAVAAQAARSESGDRANSYTCGDPVTIDQTTSGGERLVHSMPCWDLNEESAAHQRYLAHREREIARAERRSATSLVEIELAACRGMPERELEHSPFAHRKEIAAVIPHRDAGRIRGVRVVFKPVPGLTAAWLRQAIACHRARFERLGEPSTYLPDDPTLLARTTAIVEEHSGRLEVTIESSDETSAHAALDRAQDLVRVRTADR